MPRFCPEMEKIIYLNRGKEKMENKQIEATRQTHRASLLKSLERRLEVAKANGQTKLVNQLEAEKRYYLK